MHEHALNEPALEQSVEYDQYVVKLLGSYSTITIHSFHAF